MRQLLENAPEIKKGVTLLTDRIFLVEIREIEVVICNDSNVLKI
jgi:hypothetical protein